jgi:hypothetical protein
MRKKCGALYAEGTSVLEIAAILQRSRNWVYKWAERSQSDDDAWYLSQSTEPYTKPRKISADVERAIVHSRKFLQQRNTPATQYAFCGAVGIHQDLDRKGIEDKPCLSTINRVLSRNGLVEADPRTGSQQKRIYYPAVRARHAGFIHQLDLITPLYIAGYGKISSVNRIDVCTSHANLQQYDAKNAESIISFVIDDWKTYGVPRYLQGDNEAAFRGGLYHPRSFGKLVRFCLNFGVQMIFIPFNEPWRNGHVESFNGRFQKLVWNRHRFLNLLHVRVESAKFREQHNTYQGYRKEHFGRLPRYGYTQGFLPESFAFDPARHALPVTTGLVHFVRQVDEEGSVSIFNETFFVDKKLSYEYVWAVLNTKEQSLAFFYKATKEAEKIIVLKINYHIRELVKNRIPINRFAIS